MRPAGRLFVGAMLACLLAAPGVAAQDALVDLGGKAARVSRAPDSGRLASARVSRVETLRAFLRARHDEPTLRDLVQTREHVSGGVAHVSYGQRAGDLDVYGTYVKASFAPTGDLRSVIENLVSTARALRPAQVGPEVALRAVLQRYYPALADLSEVSSVGNVYTFERRPPFAESPTVTRVALPLVGNVLDVGYLVATWDRDNTLRYTAVTGRGQIVGEQLRTNADAYRIFPNHPGVTPQVLVTNPADPTASPLGWVTSDRTTGNNVDAYLDRNTDDVPDLNSRPVSGSQVFDFLWDGASDPTTSINQMVAVTNLFYLNNVLHDRLYGYGFTESAGNFQENNFSNGGLGGDPVNAEAQDGGAFNNANFATPPDGQRPRMQMYLWNGATPNRDGDVDSDIVYHEYGHGLTWRLIGDMSGVTGGAVGEGMSDALANLFNGDDRVAEYSSNNPIGIRQYPYTNYPRTYGLVVGILGPHLDGEIYAATIWRLRELWLAKGWSQEVLLRYIVDGMNYTVPKPAYEDMRDGILASITNLPTSVNAAQARCTVWDAFSQFGIGVGADGREICALGLCLFKATESFVKPADCPSTPLNHAPVPSIVLPTPNTTVLSGATVSFSGSATDTEDGDLTASMTWTSSLQGSIGTGGSFSRSDLVVGTHVITASVTDTGGLIGSATVTLTVSPPPNTTPTVTITSPTGGSFPSGTAVNFVGTATDTQQGTMTSSLAWVSNLQGQIGTGGSFSRNNLVTGTHVITASVTDNGGLTGAAQVTITITAPVSITLSATGSKVKGVRTVALAWTGASGTVAIYRNNVFVINDTASPYTDSIPGKGAGTFSYRVCNVGTQVCSNTVSVTF